MYYYYYYHVLTKTTIKNKQKKEYKTQLFIKYVSMIKSSSVKLNQRTAEYLYMLKTKPKLKLFQNEIANNEKALTRTKFKRRCLKLAHTGPPGAAKTAQKEPQDKEPKSQCFVSRVPPHEPNDPKDPARTKSQSILKFL